MNPQLETLFSVEELMSEARNITGISLIDSDAIEPLSMLVKSYNEEVSLTEKSAVAVKKYLLRMLCNRLRMQRDIAAHPEILEQTLQPPVFICGMPRTGSTKTQKVLAASGDFNCMTCWQGLNPSLINGSKEESPDARIDDCDDFVDWLNATSPTLRYTHELATHEPEEETWLNMCSLRTMMVLGVAEMITYPQWVMAQNYIKEQMNFLRDALKYLQWQGYGSAAKPWILKTPYYYGHEVTIKEAFPDARFIMTHRHPKETIASVCSLMKDYQKPVSDKPIDLSMFVAGISMQVEQHLKNRKDADDINWLDIDYKELIDSLVEATEKIYSFLGMSLSDIALKKVLTWNDGNRFVKGGHKYTLADAGITEQQVNEQFSGYIELLRRVV